MGGPCHIVYPPSWAATPPRGPSHDMEKVDSIPSVQPDTDAISLRVTEAGRACDWTLAKDTRGEVCPGLEDFPPWALPLAGLVAGRGGHGNNRGPFDVLKILIASCLPFNPPVFPAM